MMLLPNVAAPNYGVRHKEDNTVAFIDGRNAGSGELYISESQVSWMTAAGQGFELEYPKICLHAISRDLASFPQECLYLQIDGKLFDDAEDEGNSSEEEDDCPVTEVRFVPSDKLALEPMFSAMSTCQALHPDPDDDSTEEVGEEQGDGDGGEYDQFYDAENADDAVLTAQGRATLQHLENLLHAGQGDTGAANNRQQANGNVEAMEDEGGQFDDADMEQ